MLTYFYKIVSKDPNIKDCYVGRTTNFKKRKAVHKSRSNTNTPLYKFISENGGWDCFELLVFDVSGCDSVSKLQRLEKQYIEDYKANLNIHVPGRTTKQYYLDHHDKRKQQMRQYYNTNTEKCKELMKRNYDKKRKVKATPPELAETVPFKAQ